MLGEKFLTFVSYLLFILSVQGQAKEDMKLDTPSTDVIATQVMTNFFQLDELGKLYCKKYSHSLPIWCDNCKGQRLALCDFPSYLLTMVLSNASDKKETNKKEVEKLALIFDKFLKILTETDPQESTMVNFVLQETKNINFLCPHCQCKAWKKIPEHSSRHSKKRIIYQVFVRTNAPKTKSN